MTVDTTPSTSGNAATDRLNNAGVSNRPAYVAYVALAFAAAGLIFCWYPIIGTAHALAGIILGIMAYRQTHRRIALYAAGIGAVAAIAAVVLTIIEVNSIETVNTYSAAPWI